MKKFNYILFIIIIFSSGCTANTETNSTPPALQSLMDLTENLLTSIENEDIDSSITLVKSIHYKWNSYYPYIINNEAQSQNKDSFNKNLNTLTNSLISIQYKEIKKEKTKEINYESKKEDGDQSKESSEEDSKKEDSEEKDSEEKDSKTDSEIDSEKEADSEMQNQDSSDKLSQKEYSKEALSSLYYTNQLFKNNVLFLSSYDNTAYPQILLLKYYIRNIKIKSLLEQFDSLNTDIEKIKTIYNTIKLSIPSNNKNLATQLEVNIEELSQNINDKEKNIIDIKCEIALKNIEALLSIKSELD